MRTPKSTKGFELNVLCYVDKSSIPGAGLGLFAKKDISKNSIITYYDGIYISKTEADQLKEKNKHWHVITIDRLLSYIDGLKKPLPFRGAGSFANDAKDPSLTNAKFWRNSNKIWVKAIKNIKKGDEIFVSYGKQYWRIFEQVYSR